MHELLFLVKFISFLSVFLLIVQSHPHPLPQEDTVDENFEQEIPSSQSDPAVLDDPEAFVDDLKKYVMSVPILAFEGDAILLQFPDPLNRVTTYRHLDPWGAIAEPVYETKGNDAGLSVVILTSDQDKIPLPKGDKVKRTYVILRKAIQLQPMVYFVSYLYVTEAPDNIPGIHNLGGRKVFLEWDFWDHRESVDVRAKSLENAFRCSNNIFIPCASNDTMDFPQPPQRSAEFTSSPVTEYPAANPKIEERFHVADGYDPDEFMDIYGDLDREIKLGRDANEIPNDAAPPAPYLGRGDAFTGKSSGNSIEGGKSPGETLSVGVVVKNVVRVVLDTTMGLVKDFEGLYGGLGTIDGDLAAIGLETGFEGTDDLENGNLLSEEEKNALEAQVKEVTAGGLGGMITGLETFEVPVDFTVDQVNDQINPLMAKGRALGAAWDPPGGEEKPYVQFGWIKPNGAVVVNDVFVGFGACRYHKVKLAEVEALHKGDTHSSGVIDLDVEEHLRLYTRALRTQCVSYDTDFLLEILKGGVLKVGDDKSFELQEKSVHFTVEKLTVKQIKELLRGVQLASFSKVYNSELRSLTASPAAPEGSPLSRSVYTLGQMVIGVTSFSQEHLWVDMRHGFKLNRNMIRTLKIAYVKLGEDKELLGEGDSGFEKELNYNNRVYLMGLIQYLLRGSAPVYNTGVNPYKNFEEFYTRNKQVLEDRVNSRIV